MSRDQILDGGTRDRHGRCVEDPPLSLAAELVWSPNKVPTKGRESGMNASPELLAFADVEELVAVIAR